MPRKFVKQPHGTAMRYQQKCRCRGCRVAWAEYCLAQARKRGRPARATRYFSGPHEEIVFKPTRLGLQILSDAEERTGVTQHDILEQLLRTTGQRVVMSDDRGLRTCSD